MVNRLKDVSEKLLKEDKKHYSTSDSFYVRGISQLDGECNIHIVSGDFEFFLNYQDKRCIKLFGSLGNLTIHRNVVVEEYTSSNIRYRKNGEDFVNIVGTLLPSKKLGVRDLFKIFNFYSEGELVLSLFFSYERDGCGYELIIEGEEEYMLGVL